jgi:aspartyl-tRNA(Asn)/glutamyl-tRNA(Gln) amidotransferase subunit A
MPLRTHIFRRLSSTLSAGNSDAAKTLRYKHDAINRHEHANANLDRLIYHEDKKHDVLAKARNVYKVQEAEQWGFQIGWNNAANISSETPRAVKPLHQAIVSIKDNIATADLNTTCASNILEGWQPTRDATVVKILREKESLIIAKTNMDEFGMGSHSTYSAKGKVRNGRKEVSARSVGGSSGGSAIAVALAQCSVALGTDTGGSVRLPAAYTGVMGFKPSYGLLSRYGVVPYANSLDTVGILGQTRRMIQDVFEALDQYDENDPTSVSKLTRSRIKQIREDRRKARALGSGNYRIGVPIEYNVKELDPLVRKAWARTLTMLEDHGHQIVTISLPSTRQALSAYYILAPAEASSNLGKYDGVRYGASQAESAASASSDLPLFASLRGSAFGDEVKRRILLGTYSLSASAMDNYFVQAQKVRRLVQQDFDRVFKMQNPLHDHHDTASTEDDGVDFIICPTAPTPPPLVSSVQKQDPLDAYVNDVLTVPASLAGLPAISVPAPLGTESKNAKWDELIGMQIIGQYGDDHSVLECAALMAELEPEIEHRCEVAEAMNAKEVSF